MVIKSPHSSATSLSSSGQQYRPAIPVEAFSAGQESTNDLESDLGSVASSLESAKIEVLKQNAAALASRYKPADVSDAVDAILSVNLSNLQQMENQVDLLFSDLLRSTGTGSSVARVEGSLIYQGVTFAPVACAVSGDNQSSIPASLSITTYPNPVVVTNSVSCTVTSIDLEILEYRWRDNSTNNNNWSRANDSSVTIVAGNKYELAIRVRIPSNVPYQGLPVWELQYIISSDPELPSDIKPGIWEWISTFGSLVPLSRQSWDPAFLDPLHVKKFVTNPGPGNPGLLTGLYADSIIHAPEIQTDDTYKFYETEVRFLIEIDGGEAGKYLFLRLHPTSYTSSEKFRTVSYTRLLNTPWAGPIG